MLQPRPRQFSQEENCPGLIFWAGLTEEGFVRPGWLARASGLNCRFSLGLSPGPPGLRSWRIVLHAEALFVASSTVSFLGAG